MDVRARVTLIPPSAHRVGVSSGHRFLTAAAESAWRLVAIGYAMGCQAPFPTPDGVVSARNGWPRSVPSPWTS